MAITVSGTTITFNDGTTQTTAGGAPTTAQVLSATAGATAGAVGTYAFCFEGNYNTPGTTRAGSALRYSAGNGSLGGTPGGTWRCMSYSSYSGCSFTAGSGATLWLRIS